MLGKRKRGGAAAGNSFKKVKPVDEITFDFNKREEYLTGFHKRKLQRVKYARDEAAKQEREDKIQQRKELREERQRQVEEHVKAVNQAIKGDGGSDSEDSGGESEDEWQGIEPSTSKSVDHEDQYSDSDDGEEATVTVEAVDITRDGFQKAHGSDDSAQEEETGNTVDEGDNEGKSTTDKKTKRVWTREKPKVPKKKRKKFRYESLADRQRNRAVIKAVKSKQRARREGK